MYKVIFMLSTKHLSGIYCYVLLYFLFIFNGLFKCQQLHFSTFLSFSFTLECIIHASDAQCSNVTFNTTPFSYSLNCSVALMFRATVEKNVLVRWNCESLWPQCWDIVTRPSVIISSSTYGDTACYKRLTLITTRSSWSQLCLLQTLGWCVLYSCANLLLQ